MAEKSENSPARYTESTAVEIDVQVEDKDNMDKSVCATIVESLDGCDTSNDKPFIGMEFQTHTEAYNFYNAYALKTGFGIRRTSSTFSTKEVPVGEQREVISRTFVCNKEGKKYFSPNEGTEVSNPRRESRVSCDARMRIVLTKSKTWRVSKFVEQHNGHGLISPNKVIKHRSHMSLHRTPHVRSLIDSLHSEGMTPSIISKVVNVATTSTVDVEVRVTPQQCQDQLRKARNNNIGRECESIIDHFSNKKLSDPDFYFALELDEDRTVRSVFWADGRSRTSYLQFGDVIVFDVTYKTNKLCLPFAPFTGVNHYRQSTLFGCALLADESEKTFVWLFTEWLKCMHGQPPLSIITDQDVAMGKAIARVFPDVRHRFCSWHIGRHSLEHLSRLRSKYGEDFCTYFNKWCHSTSIDQAEHFWIELQDKFGVDENENTWLPTMYRKRHYWVDAYLKDTFWAGMKSTQRSESINAFFDGYVNSQTRLHEFMSAYDKALADRRAAELHEDFLTLNTTPVMSFGGHPIEAQAGKLYTRKIFNIFQEEIKGCIQLFREEQRKDNGKFWYSVRAMNEDSRSHQVIYDSTESIDVKCSCALFETTGILCRHVLNVIMSGQQLREIPEKYILHRWRIDARYRSLGMLGRKNLCTEEQGNFLYGWTIRAKFNEYWEMALASRQHLVDLEESLDAFAARNEIRHKQNNASSKASNVPAPELEGHIAIRDPTCPVTTKGRPKKATRMRSQREEAIESKRRKQRTCQRCFQKGHYRTSCKNPPAKKPPSEASEEDDDEDGEECSQDNAII